MTNRFLASKSKVPVLRRQCCGVRFHHGGTLALCPVVYLAGISFIDIDQPLVINTKPHKAKVIRLKPI